MLAPPKPPAHDELELLIKEARERQLRRRLFAAAGVAVAAAVGLSVYALTIGGGNQADVNGRSAGVGLSPCRSTQISATAGLSGATGTMDGVAALTNTSATGCSLPPTPPQVGIYWRGKRMPALQQRFPGLGGARVHALAPGARAFVHMDWFNWCGKPSEGALIRPTLRLAFGRLRVATRAHVMTLPRCGSPGGSTIEVSPALTD